MPLPALANLLDGADEVVKVYSKEGKRNELASFLQTATNIIRQDATPELDAEYRQISIGTGLFCRYLIIQSNLQYKYGLINPDFTEGRLWNSGSTLSRLILEKHLQIKSIDEYDDQSKFIFAAKFYEFITQNAALRASLNGQNLNYFENHALDVLKSMLQKVFPEVNNLMRAIPSESALDKAMTYFWRYHKNRKPAKSQSYFLSFWNTPKQIESNDMVTIQLITLLGGLDFPKEARAEKLSRSQRIKMGAFLYFLQTTNDVYLKEYCCENLHIDKLEQMSQEEQKSYLASFHGFLEDSKQWRTLEELGKKNFDNENALVDIDGKIYDIKTNLTKIIANFSNIASCRDSLIAQIGEQFFAVIFYGTGGVAGMLLSNTNLAIEYEKILTEFIKFVSKEIFDSSTGIYFGAIAAHFILQAILFRTGGKLFEALGRVIGNTAGSSVDWVMKTVSDSLKELCSQKNDRALIKEANPDFIKCLGSLPAEVFLNTKQIKLQQFLEENFQQETTVVCKPR